MSLINQMLQDLDARRSEATSNGQIGPQVRAVKDSRKRNPLVLAGVVVGASALAAAAAAGAGWYLTQSAQSASVKAAAPAVQAVAVVAPAATASIAHAASDAVAASSASIPATSPAVSASAAAQPAPDVANQSMFKPGHFPLKLDTRLAEVPPSLAQNTGKAVIEPAVAKPVTETQNAQILQATRTWQGTTAKANTNSAKTEGGKAEGVHAAVPGSTDAAALSGVELASAIKPSRETTPAQRAENEYRRATLALQQGRAAEALNGFEQAITIDPSHVASRQAIISLFLDRGQQDAALRRAKEGIVIDPSQIGIAMILARLHVEKSELKPAIDVLEGSLRHAGDRADYHAFLAAVLQRDGRHKDAVDHYLVAVRQTPQSGVWWMGLGMSLQAQQRSNDALEAYRRAKATNSLSAELVTFVDGRLAQLQR